MPSSHSFENRKPKGVQRTSLKRRTPSNDREKPSSKSGNKQTDQVGGSHNSKNPNQSAFDHHVSLLTDSRMSQRMYTIQRQEIFSQIQSTYGNRYAQRLADAVARKRDEHIQAKLTVGPAGDQYEQEADQIASQVVSQMSSSPVTQPQTDEQSEDDLQMKPVESQIGLEGGDIDSSMESAIEASRGNGQPLPNDVRSSMEGVFGADFSGVKVHTDSESDALNRGMQAQAFTSGQDIFFSKSAYKPDSQEGKETLAHELTHVVQQNGVEPMFNLVASHPADRDEREAEDVAHVVGKYGDMTAETIERMPEKTKIHRLKDAKSDIQRATGKRIAWAVTKGIFFGIVNAITGPLHYLAGGERKELKASWSAAGDKFNYPSVHLQNIAKTVIVLQEIGALAAWVTLLTGAGSIIAAAFAPAGLAASAILGTIATIATIVGGSIGVITAVLNSILAISNLSRARSMRKTSLARKEIMLVFWKDLTGVFAGLLAAIGGAIGFGALGGGTVIQSAEAIGTAGLGAHAAAMGTAMASDEAFAIGTETQDQLLGVVSEEQEANLAEDPNYQKYKLGQEAVKGREVIGADNEGVRGTAKAPKKQEINTDVTGRLAPNVLDELKKSQEDKKEVSLLRIQRQPEDGAGKEEDYGSQLMQEMNKVDKAASSTKSDIAEDKQLMNQEKKELDSSSTDIDKAQQGLTKMDNLSDVESNLEKMSSESDSGEKKGNEKDEEKATQKEPDKEAEVKSKEDSMVEANKSLDDIEAKSGEKFGDKKPGFFGKIFGMFKKGARAVNKWFRSGLSYLRERVQAIFAKIREKVTGIIVKFTNLKEPVEGLKEELNEAQEGTPQATAGIDEALGEITGSSSQADQLSETVEEVKKAIKG